MKDMLLPWESALNLDEQVYPNLVRVFYSNIKIFANRLDWIITYVGGVPIEFDVDDLNNILGTLDANHTIYTSRKALSFVDFAHNCGVRNICRHRDLTSDIYAFHTILHHIVTPRKGHSDEVARMDVGLLDSLLDRRPINLGYVILRHMLSTPGVNHQFLPYGSIISKILRHFQVPFRDSVYVETKRIGKEGVMSIRFSRKNREWIKTFTSKNQHTLVAPKDDRMLNDVYPPDQLLDFKLGARPPPLRRGSISQPRAVSDSEEHEMDTDQTAALKHPPTSDDLMQKLISDVQSFSEQQQQQLQSQFATFLALVAAKTS